MLDGKHAVVTGAGRNVGQGIAQIFADHGVSVAVNDIKEERCQRTIENLDTSAGQRHLSLVGDGTDSETIRSFSDRVSDEFPQVDILVNNLGYAVNRSVFETTEEEWDTVNDMTLKSGFLWAKHFAPPLRESESGSIINIASDLGHTGQKKTAYCAAKGGVLNMTRQMALDFGEYDVRVNSISPGRIGDPVGKETGENRTDRGIILNRVGKPEDIGKAALFLSSDLSEYITGVDIKVDGGLSL